MPVNRDSVHQTDILFIQKRNSLYDMLCEHIGMSVVVPNGHASGRVKSWPSWRVAKHNNHLNMGITAYIFRQSLLGDLYVALVWTQKKLIKEWHENLQEKFKPCLGGGFLRDFQKLFDHLTSKSDEAYLHLKCVWLSSSTVMMTTSHTKRQRIVSFTYFFLFVYAWTRLRVYSHARWL